MRIVKCNGKTIGQMFAQHGNKFVYCGRAWAGFPESPLANRFRVGRHGSLAEVLAKYRTYLYQALTCADPELYSIAIDFALRNLHADSVLGCWCVEKDEAGTGDEQCHCDVIAKAHRWLTQQVEV